MAYLGYEFVNFARHARAAHHRSRGQRQRPSVARRSPCAARPSRTPESPSSNLRENPTVTADADGRFEVILELVPGSNVIRLVARDPSPTATRSRRSGRWWSASAMRPRLRPPSPSPSPSLSPMRRSPDRFPRGSAPPGTTVRISLAPARRPHRRRASPCAMARDGVVALAPPNRACPARSTRGRRVRGVRRRARRSGRDLGRHREPGGR